MEQYSDFEDKMISKFTCFLLLHTETFQTLIWNTVTRGFFKGSFFNRNN